LIFKLTEYNSAPNPVIYQEDIRNVHVYVLPQLNNEIEPSTNRWKLSAQQFQRKKTLKLDEK
jgi:hypothetical protein